MGGVGKIRGIVGWSVVDGVVDDRVVFIFLGDGFWVRIAPGIVVGLRFGGWLFEIVIET